MLLEIKYSLAFETRRILETIKKLDWYKRHGYRAGLPKSLNVDDSHVKKITRQSIKQILLKEYRKDDYKKALDKLNRYWKRNSADLSGRLERPGLKTKKSYVLILTQYGVNGSYYLPDVIVINFRKKSLKRIFKIIAHEIIHLEFEKSAMKRKLTHEQKEKLVNSIYRKTGL
ncbi:MAG: hypothetical protein Q7K44_00525 [Candidatus Liptonbacteria bacterium]|nr:hypothetical protein [Candidatus Liptonbacteria bacterium]